jgi:membrane-anchored protein YejM (alkaline phosphatase superfamily)
VAHSKINTLEEQVSRSQSLYAELDEQTRVQINKLRNEGHSDMSEIHKKYEQSLKQKDDNLRQALSQIE